MQLESFIKLSYLIIFASLYMINVCVGVLHPKNTSKLKQYARESIFASSLIVSGNLCYSTSNLSWMDIDPNGFAREMAPNSK